MELNDFKLLDALFLGLNHPGAAAVLQASARIDWKSGALPMPKCFLVPLASPEGKPIGFVEFRFLATTGDQARFAATAVHSVRDAKRLSLPRLPALSPLPRGAP